MVMPEKPYRVLVVARRIDDAFRVMKLAGVQREQWRYILTEEELFGWREPDIAIVYCDGWADGPKAALATRLRFLEVRGATGFNYDETDKIRAWVAEQEAKYVK